MKKIFKYQLNKIDKQTLKLPVGSKVLSATNQSEEVMLYALVDPGQRWKTETFIFKAQGGKTLMVY